MSNPQAHLTVQKSRVKLYDGKYYVKNGTEFEIELFNPTSTTICACISINGKNQDTGLVLKPGQRYFLERYFNIDRKFKFETYTVEAGNAEVDAAIAKNGVIKIEFYKEKSRPTPRPNFNTHIKTTSLGRSISTSFDPNELLRSNFVDKSSFFSSCDTSVSGNAGDTYSTYSYSDIPSYDWMDQAKERSFTNINLNTKEEAKEKETGRIEEGGVSNQTFSSVNTEFELWPFHVVDFQINPLSQKPVENGEVAMYCCECGRKSKRSENFCPKCGADLVAQRKALGIE